LQRNSLLIVAIAQVIIHTGKIQRNCAIATLGHLAKDDMDDDEDET